MRATNSTRSTEPRDEGSSVALLIDLVTNTLDPGYAAAAEHRANKAASADGAGGDGGRKDRRRIIDRSAVAIGCALVGFVLALAYVSTHRDEPRTEKVHSDLVNRVRSAQQVADDLNATAQRLAAQIDPLRNQALGAGSLRSQLQLSQLLAGTAAAVGPGLVVELANPPTPTASAGDDRKGSTPIGATQLLTDRDVRSVVNQLWTDGAEAISVNDIRLTPTSAIRFAGQAVLVDFQPINAPYVIRAIGDADTLDTEFASSPVASRYQTLASARGISFHFDQRGDLHLPASTLSTPEHAHPLTTPSSATTGATR